MVNETGELSGIFEERGDAACVQVDISRQRGIIQEAQVSDPSG